MNNQVRCKKCGGKEFTIGDYELINVLETQLQILKIDGFTKHVYDTPYICIKCGQKRQIDCIEIPNKELTLTFYPKNPL